GPASADAALPHLGRTPRAAAAMSGRPAHRRAALARAARSGRAGRPGGGRALTRRAAPHPRRRSRCPSALALRAGGARGRVVGGGGVGWGRRGLLVRPAVGAGAPPALARVLGDDASHVGEHALRERAPRRACAALTARSATRRASDKLQDAIKFI